MGTVVRGLLASALGSMLAAHSVAIKLPNVPPVKLMASANLEGPAGSKEVSGIVASRQWPGTFWVQNDSGDGPRIIPSTGTVV